MNLSFYKNKKIGVLGFGKTGAAAVDTFVKSGAEVFLYDDIGVKNPFYKQYERHFSDFDWDNLSALFVSPGIHILWDKIHEAVKMANKYGIKIINDLDLMQMHYDKNLICITGTNGKSTTTALTYHILSQANRNVAVGGNFGTPIFNLDINCDDYILELSSYQLETCNILGFQTAVLLNITHDHLTRHGGIIGYSATKHRIFANFSKNSNAIVSIDDQYSLEIYNFLQYLNHPNIIPISGHCVPKNGIGWKDNCLYDNRTQEIICDHYFHLDGTHNRQNIAASYAACSCNNISKEEFQNSLFTFHGLAHRQEIIANKNNITFVNDSKATNAESVEHALKRFDNILWILGGMPKEDGIISLQKHFNKITHAFLIGEAAQEWYSLLRNYNVKAKISTTLDQAVIDAYDFAKLNNGKVILLSPACASFDQFKNFEERGDAFKMCVEKILK